MELCQQFPRLGHSDQYRPMLRRSHHASELQALLGVLTIFFYFGPNHETSPTAAPQNAKGGDGFHGFVPVRRRLTAVPLVPKGLCSCSSFRAPSSRTIL